MQQKSLINEIRIFGYSQFDHQNHQNATIIMEFAKNGDLSQILNQSRLSLFDDFSNTTQHIILIYISRGIKYLHDQNIILDDLKPHNILLNND